MSGLFPKPAVLVVDDEADNREILRFLLEDDGYAVLTAGNGREALRWMRQVSVDIVLLDLMLPDLDGRAVCGRIRAAPSTANVPVLFLSAYGDRAIREEALRNGAFDFLDKPVRASELRVKMRALIQMAGAAPQAGARLETYRELVRLGAARQQLEDARLDHDWHHASFELPASPPRP